MAASPEPRSHSRASFYSTTTYHSFQDIELYDPNHPPETKASSTAKSPREGPDSRPASFQMVRQDSGYESSTPPPPHSSHSAKRRRRSAKQTSPSPPRMDRSQRRPALKRSGAGGPLSYVPGRSSLTLSRPTSLSQQQQQNLNRKHSYFQFPSPEHLDSQEPSSSSSARPKSSSEHDPYHHADPPTSPLSLHVPPQTTHYWTSDRTRRLEYAAIDAASRGVRGWVMRNMVPECFVPKANRRVGFDDDGGSVRRYRLDLEIECPEDSVPPSPVAGGRN
ncbi:hypothetical protein M406DRAFT_99877 [Cryphonectria parasitica EP155]|uniref:Uncharacterized protein n=1 Tax=Cryphonectria parasitica (strain ATCC 38755 / EP155) TaxID=660469 RepID=A0A9P5CLB6_CRYP1|nr:uncharacterized protein M406DRAFT_99877 [Cryphonectria parasitica EP155]KAF3761660.1 hypothetical protein M406DRAFT_99877 [Cryphonectria parasitica EP155]